MTINVPIWAGLLYSVVLIGAAFGASVAAFRRGDREIQNETRDAQKDAIDALSAQIAINKDTITGQAHQIAALEAKVAALERFNAQLADLLTGRPDWAKLSEQIDKIAKHLGIA